MIYSTKRITYDTQAETLLHGDTLSYKNILMHMLK